MLPALVCLAIAAIVGQQIGLYGHTGPVEPGWFPAADKLQHALGFALPMFLVLTTIEVDAARSGRSLRPLGAALIAGVFAINAVVSELVQARPGSGRSGDPYDAVADLVGIVLGWLAFAALRRRPWVRETLRAGGET